MSSWMRALEPQGIASPTWVPGTSRARAALAQRRETSAELEAREQHLSAREQALQTQIREIEALRARYESGIKALDAACANVTKQQITEATEIAFAVGSELAQRELSTSATALAEMVRGLLNDLGEEKPTVRMAPKDAERFQAQLPAVTLIADDTLEPGSAIVVGREASIDASFRERALRVREALGLHPLQLVRQA